MATEFQPSGNSSLSRLSRLGQALRLRSPSSPVRGSRAPVQEELYIAYNGPYEKSRSLTPSREGGEWGSSGWSGDKEGRVVGRLRSVSSASPSRLSIASGGPSRKSTSTRANAVHIPQPGGVGDSPTPSRRPQLESYPTANRSSIANFLTLGSSKRRATIVSTAPEDELRRTSPSNGGLLPRPHPYAYAVSLEPSSPTPTPPKNRTSRFNITLLEPIIRRPSASALAAQAKADAARLKSSKSTPNLRLGGEKPRTPVSPQLPRAKYRWLSAETWCDAIFLPRPRFAMRVDDSTGAPVSSGRIVSPPGSPIWASGTGPNAGTRVESPTEITSMPERSVLEPSLRRREVRKSKSASQLVRARSPSFTAGWPPPAPAPPVTPQALQTGSATLRPPRPKSFAWDDLSIPSPVPSLSKVLEDGRQLEAERKAWQTQATRSLGNARARTLSRSRAKSLTASRQRLREHPSTLDILAERGLLGSQTRPQRVHVRVRSPSEEHERGGFGISTFTSGTHTEHSLASHPPTRTRSTVRSHAHSNSVGTATSHPQTDESFWAPQTRPSGHARAHSIGKSALRAVKQTATSAATFCGLNGDGISPAEERPGFNAEQERSAEEGQVVVIGAPPPLSRSYSAGAGGLYGVSPTPSGSTSGEGVGIAISTSPDDQPHSQLLRIPAHPYAQASNYSYHPPVIVQPSQSSEHPVQLAVEESPNRHRQPVMPYSPYTRGLHPYAAIEASRQSGAESMFAQVRSGYIREILPEEIRYSPYTPTFGMPAQAADRDRDEHAQGAPARYAHPYAPQSKRMSEWAFGDALAHTLRQDTDAISHPSDMDVSVAQILVNSPDREGGPPMPTLTIPEHTSYSSRIRPDILHETPQTSYALTVSSSPMESINPPMFRHTHTLSASHSIQSSAMLNGHSSGSSPGVVSQQSSPPLSPRPLGASDDMERFRDLFFQPPDPTRTPSEESPGRPGHSRQVSGHIPFELSSRRTASGLTSLARQLTEDMEELRELERARELYDNREGSSPMWGRRLGGLRGERPEDTPADPNVVLSRTSDESTSASGSPLRLPLAEHMSLTAPVINIPEDVVSSRASSMLESPLMEEPNTLRLGTIEAISTPPPLPSPHRRSAHLSFIGDVRDEQQPQQSARSSELLPRRIISLRSSSGGPVSAVSDTGRSSFLTATTNMSRMSGLSDFPEPPMDLTPEHMSVLNSYFDGSPQGEPSENLDSGLLRPRDPTLIREPSRGTFGRHRDDGQAS